MKTASLWTYQPLQGLSIWLLTWQIAFPFFFSSLFLFSASQFDVIRQDLWEDRAETSPERALENRAEHHRENDCSASTEWPEREPN